MTIYLKHYFRCSPIFLCVLIVLFNISTAFVIPQNSAIGHDDFLFDVYPRIAPRSDKMTDHVIAESMSQDKPIGDLPLLDQLPFDLKSLFDKRTRTSQMFLRNRSFSRPFALRLLDTAHSFLYRSRWTPRKNKITNGRAIRSAFWSQRRTGKLRKNNKAMYKPKPFKYKKRGNRIERNDSKSIISNFVATKSASSSLNTPSSTSRMASSAVSSTSTSSGGSNLAQYNATEARYDLNRIMKWAQDEDNLDEKSMDEVVAAILSAATRYFPELPTKAIARILLADIKAESDFNPRDVSGGRLDSGTSVGLLQVSPNGESKELDLWKKHASVSNNTFTWRNETELKGGARFVAGPLLDWKTNKQMDIGALKYDDLLRPWVNIHVAAWIQSNSARTSSQDPSLWKKISCASVATDNAAKKLANATSPHMKRSSCTKSHNLDVFRNTLTSKANSLKKSLDRPGLPRSILTALGTWVAGAASNGEGSYQQKGDDISDSYLNHVTEGVRFLYDGDSSITTDWLDALTLEAGLVDYH